VCDSLRQWLAVNDRQHIDVGRSDNEDQHVVNATG